MKKILAALALAAFSFPAIAGFDGSLTPTYHVALADVSVAATATDVFTLCGSATKNIIVTRLQITADATSASVIDFYVYKRTAANTGGTATSPTIAQMDSASPASTATVKLYSANPSALGAGVLIVGDHYALPAASTTGYPGQPWIEDFGIRGTQPLILHGTSECLAINLNGQTIPSGFSMYVMAEYMDR